MSTARAFNGTSDKGVSAATINLSSYGSVAVAYWAKVNSYANDPELVMHGATYGAGGFGIDCGGSTTTVSALGRNVGTGGLPATGSWLHFAFCYTGASGSNPLFTWWLNGVAGTNNGLTNATAQTFLNASLYLASYGGGSNFLSGSLAQLGIWGAAGNTQILTSGNISSLAAGALPSAIQNGSLAHYWKLDGVSGANGSETDQKGSVALNFTGTSQDSSGPTLGGGAAAIIPPGLFLPSYSIF